MTERISLKRLYSIQPAIPDHIIALQKAANAELDMKLVYLMKIRASQMNGCLFCIRLNREESLKIGETLERLQQLEYWKDSPLYSPEEKAALTWTEITTFIATNGIDDDAYESLQRHFSEREIVNMTAVIAAINSWNRLCIAAGIQ